MRAFWLTLCFLLNFLLVNLLFALESRLFEGVLDERGKLKIDIVLPENEPFILQGFLFYRESWRPIPLFWNKVAIWADLGPDYRGLPYRVHLQFP